MKAPLTRVRFLIISKKPGKTIEEVFPAGVVEGNWPYPIPDVDEWVEWFEEGDPRSYKVANRLMQFEGNTCIITIQLRHA